MWLDLAELELILGALEHIIEHPPGPINEPGYVKLRDYFREQVAGVQKVSDEWERRKKDER